MDWLRIAPDFTPDGSLRDIYILDTTLDDWGRVWKLLTGYPNRLTFEVDGEAIQAPATVDEAFDLSRARSVCASYALGKQRLNCHFFTEGEVEFDLDPRDVDGPVEAERLAHFLSDLGRVTSKEVRLTPENEPKSIIARYDPTIRSVIWVPAAT